MPNPAALTRIAIVGAPQWTPEYFTVQHLKPLPKGWQVTVEGHEPGVVRCFILAPGSGFTSVAEETFDTAAAARAWGERQAGVLIGKGVQS